MARPPSSSRSEPRISSAKLGEYRGASARRRETIIKEQMDPPTFIIIRYTDARNAIQASVVRNKDVVGQLDEWAAKIDAKFPRNKQDGDSIRCNAEAVRQFRKIYPRLDLKGTTPLLVSPKGFSFTTEGVKISVTPVVLLRRARKGKDEYGAISCVFRKTEALQPQGGRVVAELIRMALSTAGYENVRPDMCIAIDVFGDGIFTTSGSGTRIREEISAICREIAARWDRAA